MGDYERMVERLRATADEALLGVGRYDADQFEVLYISENFATRYPMDKLGDIAQDMYLEHISSEHQENLLYDFGELHATIRLFEGGAAFHVPTGETTGFGFGIEMEAMSDAVDLVDICLDYTDD